MGKTVAILGAGSWGTALSTLCAENGFNVILWSYENETAEDIRINRINNRYLPNVKLSEKIQPTTDLLNAFKASNLIFEAIPVKYIRNTLIPAKPYITKDHTWVATSKGMEQNTFMLPSEIICDIFGPDTQITSLGGPNFAKDVAVKAFTATVIASKDLNLAQQVATTLSNSYFKPYTSEDVKGVQIGGAIKNILAISIGIAHGLNYHENTIAYLMTKCLTELSTLIKHLGGKKETAYGLSGFGDLFLTCRSNTSKNFKFGKLLGQGHSLTELSKEYATLPEGINTLKTIKQLIDKKIIDLPICLSTYEFTFEGRSFKNLFHRLISESLTKEFDQTPF